MKPKEWMYRIFIKNVYGNAVFALALWTFAVWFCKQINGGHW